MYFKTSKNFVYFVIIVVKVYGWKSLLHNYSRNTCVWSGWKQCKQLNISQALCLLSWL